MKFGLNIAGLDQLKSLRKKIERFPQQAAAASVRASNDVAKQIETEAVRDITQKLNLPASYIRDKFKTRYAKQAGDVIIIGARMRPVRLARYAAEQLTVAAKYPNHAKGDPLRKIAAGRKQAGVSVKVLRSGARKAMKKAFLIPLRAGNVDGGNGFGLFEREGKQIVHRYALSPDQEFRSWIKAKRPEVSDRLARAFSARFAAELRKGRA